jgi:hypothetical protein
MYVYHILQIIESECYKIFYLFFADSLKTESLLFKSTQPLGYMYLQFVETSYYEYGKWISHTSGNNGILNKLSK